MKTGQRTKEGFDELLAYLKRTRGFDFAAYKRDSLMRRTRKRMQEVRIGDFEQYVDYLEVHPEEFALLFNTVLINVTSFLRDPKSWEYLKDEIIPRLVEDVREGQHIRVWSAGCASGEEAYSLAILLCEALGTDLFQKQVKVYATDVDEEALAQARAGVYSEAQLEPLSEKMRNDYFTPHGQRFIFRSDLRRAVIFGRHDLVQDAPISRLDLLVCRNTLMYLNAETQTKILARFHFAMNDSGFLFLGRAEMLLTHGNLFTPVEVKYRVFRKLPKVSYRERLLVMAQTGDTEAASHLGRHVRLREAAFEMEPIARIIVDMSGVVSMINDRMRADFGVDPKDVGKPLQDLEISYRPTELRSLMERARAERRLVTAPRVERRLADGSSQYFDVDVGMLATNGGAQIGYSISFLDITQFSRLQGDLERSNEELQTANEELQSAQEELETSNEELQSTNEELETVNTEARQRSDELDEANAFLKSILKSLRAGVVVLDTDLKVTIWNYRAEDLWGLRAEEVKGKPFLDLEIGLPVDRLEQEIRGAASGGPAGEEIVLEAMTRRGRRIECRVSCTPLASTNGGAISGVVLVMIERHTSDWRQADGARGKNEKRRGAKRSLGSR